MLLGKIRDSLSILSCVQQHHLVVTLGYDKIHDCSQVVSPSQTVCVEGAGDVGSKPGLGGYATHPK